MNNNTRTEPKYRILHIGTIERAEDGSEHPVGWVMDGEHSYASHVSIDYETGVQSLGGYTIDELKAILVAEDGMMDSEPDNEPEAIHPQCEQGHDWWIAIDGKRNLVEMCAYCGTIRFGRPFHRMELGDITDSPSTTAPSPG